MSEETKNRLYEAAISGTLDNLRAAFEACSTDEWERYGRATFQHAVKNPNPAALEMVKFLMTKGRRCSNVSGWQMKPDSYMLRYAAKNTGPCALDIMKLLMKHYCDSEGRKVTDSWMLRYAAGNIGPCALGMVKFLMKHEAKADLDTLCWAAANAGPHALDIVKFVREHLPTPLLSSRVSSPAPTTDNDSERQTKMSLNALNHAAANTGPCALDIMKFLMEHPLVFSLEPSLATTTDGSEEQVRANSWTLRCAVQNTGPHALDMVKLTIEQGRRCPNASGGQVRVNFDALCCAVRNQGPHALEIVEFIMEHPHNSKGCVRPNLEMLQHVANNEGPCALDIMKLVVKHLLPSLPSPVIDVSEEQAKAGSLVLRDAAKNIGPCALGMVKFLMDCQDLYAYGCGGATADSHVLRFAAKNPSPFSFDMVKFLIERGVTVKSNILFWAAENTGPCTLDIVKFMIGQDADPHGKDINGNTVFRASLHHGENFVVADYLLSRDDFLLSDLMPRTGKLSIDTYEKYREKAIARVSKVIDEKGLSYARTVAADIEKVLKTKRMEPTEEDIEALQPLVRKIASMDWVSDAKVKSDEFLGYEVER